MSIGHYFTQTALYFLDGFAYPAALYIIAGKYLYLYSVKSLSPREVVLDCFGYPHWLPSESYGISILVGSPLTIAKPETPSIAMMKTMKIRQQQQSVLFLSVTISFDLSLFSSKLASSISFYRAPIFKFYLYLKYY